MQPISPSNGFSIPRSQASTILFQWNSYYDPPEYQVLMGVPGSGASVWSSAITTSNDAAYTGNLAAGTYWWLVEASFETNGFLILIDSQSFTLTLTD